MAAHSVIAAMAVSSFNALDTDGDGSIDARDLVCSFAKVRDISYVEAVELTKLIMLKGDRDGGEADGKLTFTECKKLVIELDSGIPFLFVCPGVTCSDTVCADVSVISQDVMRFDTLRSLARDRAKLGLSGSIGAFGVDEHMYRQLQDEADMRRRSKHKIVRPSQPTCQGVDNELIGAGAHTHRRHKHRRIEKEANMLYHSKCKSTERRSIVAGRRPPKFYHYQEENIIDPSIYTHTGVDMQSDLDSGENTATIEEAQRIKALARARASALYNAHMQDSERAKALAQAGAMALAREATGEMAATCAVQPMASAQSCGLPSLKCNTLLSFQASGHVQVQEPPSALISRCMAARRTSIAAARESCL